MFLLLEDQVEREIVQLDVILLEESKILRLYVNRA